MNTNSEQKNVNEAGMYLIVEIIERELVSHHFRESYEAAIACCNELLKERVKDINFEKEFEAGEDKESEWECASAESPAAWCNWSEPWDAHIVPLK